MAGRVVARGDKECRGCVAKIHVLIRRDPSGLRSHHAEAPYVATRRVTGQKSAEAIVGVGLRHEAVWRLETSPKEGGLTPLKDRT
jgi:hypothetical protein